MFGRCVASESIAELLRAFFNSTYAMHMLKKRNVFDKIFSPGKLFQHTMFNATIPCDPNRFDGKSKRGSAIEAENQSNKDRAAKKN